MSDILPRNILLTLYDSNSLFSLSINQFLDYFIHVENSIVLLDGIKENISQFALSLLQMQPYAIRKNRALSLPAKFFVFTFISTGVIFSYRNYVGPFLRRRRAKKGEEFEQEYFEKSFK